MVEQALGAVTPPTQLVLVSPDKTPSQGLAKADPNLRSFEECLGRYETETEVESIHTFAAPTSILTADETTTTTVCTGISKANLKTDAKLKLEITSGENRKQSFSTIIDSVKPKPWHLIRKRGIIPDGLVQTQLNHFRKLTNGDKGEGELFQSTLCWTNAKAAKRKGGNLDSPKANTQRKDNNLVGKPEKL